YCRQNVLRVNAGSGTFQPNQVSRASVLATPLRLARGFFRGLHRLWEAADVRTRIFWALASPLLLPGYFCYRLYRLVFGPGYPLLQTNACGDFTLLAREVWFAMRGYAELDIFSMHLDSLLCHAAHHGGAQECLLGEPMRIFHIEHAAGSGW